MMNTKTIALWWEDNFYCPIEDIGQYPERSNGYEIIEADLDIDGNVIFTWTTPDQLQEDADDPYYSEN